MLLRHGDIAQSAIVGVRRLLRQRRLHGTGPRAGDPGTGRRAGGSDYLLHRFAAGLHAGAAADGHGRNEPSHARPTVIQIARQIAFHPFLIAAALGILSAVLHVHLPTALDRMMELLQGAAAPCALFTLGVTVALRPVEKMPWEVPPIIAVKLILHPVTVFCVLSLIGKLGGNLAASGSAPPS